VVDEGLYRQFKKNWKNFLYGMFIATILNLGVYLIFAPEKNMTPIPYANVERVLITKYDPTTSSVKYRGNFTKISDDCEFEQMVPFTITTGEYKRGSYSDLHGRGQYSKRLPGRQSLDIQVHTHGMTPSEIELRTVHECTVIVEGNEGQPPEIIKKKVTKVFDRFTVDY
jgi:hypothetical protein